MKALEAARVAELAVPTLGEGETLEELRKATYDPEALAARGLGFEYLDQLAMDHLLGESRITDPGPSRGAPAPDGARALSDP